MRITLKELNEAMVRHGYVLGIFDGGTNNCRLELKTLDGFIREGVLDNRDREKLLSYAADSPTSEKVLRNFVESFREVLALASQEEYQKWR